MASGGKKRTTMAKLMRESRLRERRLDKQAKKDARRQAPADHPDAAGDMLHDPDGASSPAVGEPELETLGQPLADA